MNNLTKDVLKLCDEKKLYLTHFSEIEEDYETVVTIELRRDNRTSACEPEPGTITKMEV
jgi:hypothetical protein